LHLFDVLFNCYLVIPTVIPSPV